MSVLEIRQAVRRYGDLRALDELTLEVEPGEVLAIVGFNGAGKTTAMKAIVGQTRLDDGVIRIFGVPAERAGANEYARLGFAIDQPFGYPELTVRTNIRLAARLHAVDRLHAVRVADAWIERLELGQWSERRLRELSLGNRQRLGLACIAAHDPELLILDEPTNSLDPAGILLLRDLILGAARGGAGVLMSSHHLDEVSRVADRIMVVHAGRVVGSLLPGGTDLERRFFALVRDADAAVKDSNPERAR